MFVGTSDPQLCPAPHPEAVCQQLPPSILDCFESSSSPAMLCELHNEHVVLLSRWSSLRRPCACTFWMATPSTSSIVSSGRTGPQEEMRIHAVPRRGRARHAQHGMPPGKHSYIDHRHNKESTIEITNMKRRLLFSLASLALWATGAQGGSRLSVRQPWISGFHWWCKSFERQ